MMENIERTDRPPAPNDDAPHLLVVDDDTRIRNLLKQYMNFRIGPLDEPAVHPDESIQLVEGNSRHGILPGAGRPAQRCHVALLSIRLEGDPRDACAEAHRRKMRERRCRLAFSCAISPKAYRKLPLPEKYVNNADIFFG